MTILESNICTIAEWMKSNEIEALISELQMIADRKYSEEESLYNLSEIYCKSPEIFPWTMESLNSLYIIK